MQTHIQYVLALLQSHGPATAFAYMEEQGLDTFPPTFVATIRESVALVLEYRQMHRPLEHEQPHVDCTVYPQPSHRARQYTSR